MISLRNQGYRMRCAKIARDYLRFESSENYKRGESFTEYACKKYELPQSKLNDYQRIGCRFLVKDKNGLPNLEGKTIFKDKYEFDDDLTVTQMALLLPLTKEELVKVFDEYGYEPSIKTWEAKEIINKVHVKKR